MTMHRKRAENLALAIQHLTNFFVAFLRGAYLKNPAQAIRD